MNNGRAGDAPDHEPLPDEDEVIDDWEGEREDDREDDEALEESSLISHLVELRARIVRITISILVVFVALFPFANDIFTVVAQPLIDQLPEGSTMIATQVASPFLTPLKTTLWVSLFVAMPVVIFQIWAFVAPGLYKKEKRFAIPLVMSSIVLFYCGMAFAYFVVFQLIFDFIISYAPDGVAVMTDINAYLDFVLKLIFAFGLAFEVPIATLMLVWSGLTTADKLAENRLYVLLGSFVVGMLMTPPDVISQTLLALPVYVLYEVGILMSRVMVRKPEPAA